MLLTTNMTMRETLDALPHAQQSPASRYWFKSPCYFVRAVDVTFHIIIPEIIEGMLPRLAVWLRAVSPRWGRSWYGFSQVKIDGHYTIQFDLDECLKELEQKKQIA